MKRELITKLHATLEKLVHKETATGTEFWLARDLQKVLGYVRWANFEKVIQQGDHVLRARPATTPTTIFCRSTRSTTLAAKIPSRTTSRDYALTRYACYLIAQNADSSKDAGRVRPNVFRPANPPAGDHRKPPRRPGAARRPPQAEPIGKSALRPDLRARRRRSAASAASAPRATRPCSAASPRGK